MTTINLNLAALNAFRAIEGMTPFADFRKARHDGMLIDFETAYTIAATNLLEDALLAEQEANAAEIEVAAVAQATKLPAYKVIAKFGAHSVPESPVAFVHGFLNANPTMTRKQAVSALVTVHQVNYSTARTQYQKWFTARKATPVVADEVEGNE